MRLKKLWLYILTPLLVLFGSATLTNTVQAKELTGAISDIKIWDYDNGKEHVATNGVHELSTNSNYANYRYLVSFDLTKYNGNLEDNDTFTLTIPKPLTVKKETFDITDPETGVVVASASVVSNGDGAGGKATITLKNLDAYLKKKGGNQVENVKGTFFVGFSLTSEVTRTELKYPVSETGKEITHIIKASKPKAQDYTDKIGKTNFSKIGGVIEKGEWQSNLLKKSGSYYHPFVVRVNDRQATYDKIVAHDYISKDYAPAQFIPETLKVKSGWYDSTYSFRDIKELVKDVDYTVEWNESYTDFKVNIKNPALLKAANGKPAAFEISYNITAPADGTQIANNVEMYGNDLPITERTDTVGKLITVVRNSRVTSGGTIQLQTGYRITLYKVDEKTQERLKGAKFKITPPKGVTKAKEETVTTNDKGVAQSEVYTEEDAKKGEFTITEIEAPAGYELDSNPIKVKVGQEGVLKTITNKRTKAKAHIEATKELVGRDLKEGEFEFTLTGPDGQVIETVKNDKNGRIKFSDLEFDTEGKYVYTIAEKAGNAPGITYDSTIMKAEVSVTKDEKGVLQAKVTDYSCSKFTNKYTPAGDTSVTLGAKKVLEGKKLEAGKYSFVLKEGDKELETVTNDADGNVTFKALTYNESQVGTHKYTISEVAGSEAGITYDKTVQEVEVKVEKVSATELKATVSKEAKDLVFTNKYTPAGETSVTLGAKKVLEGKKLEAGKYSFVLKEGDKELETVTNDADGNVTFKALTYNESQVGTHKYTISEVAGSEAGITYDKTVQEVEKVSATELKATVSKEAKDLVFTNKYTPAKTEVPVKKVWNDKENQDGKRPTSITVKLLADGQDTGKRLELTEANGWAGKFTELDADKGGTPIKYTVEEETAVKGYTTEVTGDATTGFTITNSYTPETVDITATKNWDDANNQDGKRPTKITINLLADGQKVDSKEVQAAPDGTWTAKFDKLAKYKAGKEIKYTVTEEKVSEYESSITDFNITNKYTPKTIEYKVTKVWNDANNQDGKRPDSVTVQLYKQVGDADPVAVEGKKMTLTAKDKTDENTWVASFTNLPKYEAGKEIKYSIKEVDVPAGYKASVTGQVVTNTHTPETVVISGTKVWKDNNNQDGKRTKTVKVQILNGDKVVQEIEVSEETGWKFESKELPKYENGKEIKYTVKEVVVEEYTTTVEKDKDGKYTITNTHTPEKTSVKGTKTWNDAENKDGIRPKSITVKLLANGEDTGKTATASEATGWKYEFTDLDRYQDGKLIDYSVEEVGIPDGYTAKVTGFNITNTHTPEKPTPGKPNEPGKPGQKPQLPNTGEKASNVAVVAGLALMAVTGGLYFVSRKNK